MDIRRVQMTGGSSYVLTLPKEWVQSLHLKKKDPLGVLVKDDGDLLITGNLSGEVIHRDKILHIQSDIDGASFFRSLVGSYIAGYNRIEIRSDIRIPASIRKVVREFSDQVIGLEPVEDDTSRIVLQDLFNPLEMPFDQSLKRMYSITRGMHLDSAEALIKGDCSLTPDIIIRDRDVDRLYWLISRQSSIILQSPWAGKLNNPIHEVMHYCQAARIVERIADHAVLIAMTIQDINWILIHEDIRKSVHTALHDAIKAFEQSFGSIFSQDPKKANRIIVTVHYHEEMFHKINQEILHLPTETALSIRKISDSIRRVGEYSADIAEEVINYHIGMADGSV